jgi:hypothetical protein
MNAVRLIKRAAKCADFAALYLEFVSELLRGGNPVLVEFPLHLCCHGDMVSGLFDFHNGEADFGGEQLGFTPCRYSFFAFGRFADNTI